LCANLQPDPRKVYLTIVKHIFRYLSALLTLSMSQKIRMF